MKITAAAIVLLTAGVIVLGWQLRSEMNADQRLSQEVRDLRTKLADKLKRDTFELQKQCGEQASKVFVQLGWKLDGPTNGELAAFEAHYNAGMNKCFMFLHFRSLDEMSFTSSLLYDAYEQREYAELNMTYPDHVLHIATCELMPPDGPQRTCKSEAEFRSFVAQYVESAPIQ